MKTLKLFVSIIFLSLVMTSCQKEPSNCGTVLSVDAYPFHGSQPTQSTFVDGEYPYSNQPITPGINPNDPSQYYFKVVIQNDATGNVKEFYYEWRDFVAIREMFDIVADSSCNYDTYWECPSNVTKLVGKNFCVYNYYSASIYSKISNEPIYW